jgi:hypothetical protein
MHPSTVVKHPDRERQDVGSRSPSAIRRNSKPYGRGVEQFDSIEKNAEAIDAAGSGLISRSK